MKKLLGLAALSVLLATFAGCSCNRPFLSWFNRGDRCYGASAESHCETGAPIGVGAGVNYAPSIPPGAEIIDRPKN